MFVANAFSGDGSSPAHVKLGQTSLSLCLACGKLFQIFLLQMAKACLGNWLREMAANKLGLVVGFDASSHQQISITVSVWVYPLLVVGIKRWCK